MRTITSRLPALLWLAAIATSLPILWTVVWPILNTSRLPDHGAHVPLLLVHAGAGLATLLLGTANLYLGWKRLKPQLHRWLGYGYLTLGSIGATTAIALSMLAPHEPRGLYVATGTLAAAWLCAAAMAWRAARNRRFDSHRDWMIRSFVLIWTFVGCRIATKVTLFPALGDEGVAAAVWLNWVAPLVVCEIALQWRAGGRLKSATARPVD
jgi:uncharacterized membrane protein YozB (DUF420 family)